MIDTICGITITLIVITITMKIFTLLPVCIKNSTFLTNIPEVANSDLSFGRAQHIHRNTHSRAD